MIQTILRYMQLLHRLHAELLVALQSFDIFHFRISGRIVIAKLQAEQMDWVIDAIDRDIAELSLCLQRAGIHGLDYQAKIDTAVVHSQRLRGRVRLMRAKIDEVEELHVRRKSYRGGI